MPNSYALKNTDNNVNTNYNKNIFGNTSPFKDLTGYRLMRGVPDFGSLVQFTPYETGYAVLILCQLPKFMVMLADENPDSYGKLVNNWAHIVEYEFKSFSGIEDITSETFQIGDDVNKVDIINNVSNGDSISFTINYDEKAGAPLFKFAKLYLTGIKDPKSKVKSYHGLIHAGKMEPGFENEVFTFLYIVTDNTMRKVEAAYLLLACQLQNAKASMFEYTKGTMEKQEVSLEFKGYPVQSVSIDRAAQDMIDYLLDSEAGARQIVIDSMNYDYTGTELIGKTLTGYDGGKDFITETGNNAAYAVADAYSTGANLLGNNRTNA